jgi:hypothetical protein
MRGSGFVGDSVRENAGCVAVCEVKELEGHTLRVGVYAHAGEEDMDEARIAGPLGGAVVLEGGKGMRWHRLCCCGVVVAVYEL